MRPLGVILGLSLAMAAGPIAGGHADEAVAVPQGWSEAQKRFWYSASQGSRLMPLAWLQALEQARGDKPFLDAANIERLRYLPRQGGPDGALPVGFAVDRQDDSRLSEVSRLRWKDRQTSAEPWVGLNCAACHTNEIAYQGRRLRVEGAPTLADFQTFIEDLDKALIATRDDPEKWNRFAAAVLKGADSPGNRARLRAALSRLIDWQLRLAKANETPLRYGYARLDAIGHIFNKVALVSEAAGQTFNPADAPVSYPFLWNIHQFDKVQWNGIAKNTPVQGRQGVFDLGALGRNTGEVVGVFGDIKLSILPLADGYRSSVNVANLRRLDDQIRVLKPPAWPAIFPAIDAAKQAAGRGLFVGKGCANCHRPLAAGDLKTHVDTSMALFKDTGAKSTDIWMACNAYSYQAQVGLFWGIPRLYGFGSLYLVPRASLADMLGTTVAGVLVGKKIAVVQEASDTFFAERAGPAFTFEVPSDLALEEAVQPVRDDSRKGRAERCMRETSPILGYKGRPLTGIWATAPYLHNGSVPTLYDLLLPPDQRPQEFLVGSREFDPVRVGFASSEGQGDAFRFRTRDDAGRVIDGNSNAGHDYGNAALTAAEREALVEYLKGL